MSDCSIYSMDSQECLTFEAKPWKGSLRSRSNSSSESNSSDSDTGSNLYQKGSRIGSSQSHKWISKQSLSMTQLSPGENQREIKNTKELLRVLRKAKNASKRTSPLFHLWDNQQADTTDSVRHHIRQTEDGHDENKGAIGSGRRQMQRSNRTHVDHHDS